MSPALQRLRALDLARGIAILGMFAANASTAIYYQFPDAEVYATLQHAGWIGCTTADFVFPLFLFYMGVSLALSKPRTEETGRTPGIEWIRVFRRSALLVVLGLGVNSISLLGNPDEPLRLEGTLQRIGLVYLLAVPIAHYTRPIPRAWICAVLLVCYAAALEWLPFPGVGDADLQIRNLNFSAWLDLEIFGEAALDPDADGIPTNAPLSLLSLGSSVVLTLLGTGVGEAFGTRSETEQPSPLALCTGGIALLIVGGLWGLAHPLIKLLWTSSFILYTSGAALILFGVVRAIELDAPLLLRAAWPIEAFGRNPLTAYLIHIPAVAIMSAFGSFYPPLTEALSPRAASLPFITLALGLTFLPIAWMDRRGRFFRL